MTRFPTELTLKVENLESTPYALGSVADYRVELFKALERSLERPSQGTVYTHSVLDNMAYLTFALSRYQMGTVSEDTVQRAVVAWTLAGLVVRDSFKYDHVFLLQKQFDPVEEYDSDEIQTILQMILDEYQINYSLVDVDEKTVETISETLETYFAG